MSTYIENLKLRPVFVECRIDLKHIATERLQLNPPEWATGLAAALKKGRISMILGGHEHTVKQVEFMATILERERHQNPLGQWHTPGSRYAFTAEHMNRGPIPNVTKADYKHMRRFGYHSWSEDATISKFEQVAHDLRLVKIKGLKEDTYLGFLPYPEDDVIRITPDTNLKITFFDAAGKPIAPNFTLRPTTSSFEEDAMEVPPTTSDPKSGTRNRADDSDIEASEQEEDDDEEE